MIKQIAPVRRTTATNLFGFYKGLAQARHIQAQLQGRIIDEAERPNGVFWSPITAGPYLVPVSRPVE